MKLRRRGFPRIAAVVVRTLGLALCVGIWLAADAGVASAATTYTNPVSRDFADTFADPSVILAKDGYWYAFATADPLRESETDRHWLPIARSADLVHWAHAGDVFGTANRPSWAAPDALFWAPDIRYHNETYYLYYAVTQTTVTSEPNDSAIGVATAPTPAGPWTDAGAPVIAPRRGSAVPGDFQSTIDPAAFTDVDGTHYLYYGSFYGGIMVTQLSPDGTKAVGGPTKVTADNRYEAAYLLRRGDAYYLFVSSSGCCAGPTTGYSVFVGRATSPRGPFVDRHGVSLLASRTGGTPVLAPNGNRWVGTGHNAVTTDLSGQTWFLYHGINRKDPYLNEPFGINERPLLLDRLDWVDGWPVVRDGQWASEKPQLAPVTQWTVGDDFNEGRSVGRAWLQMGDGRWTRASGDDSGGYAEHEPRSGEPSYLVTAVPGRGDLRVETDLRVTPIAFGKGAVGLVTGHEGFNSHTVSWLDAEAHALVTEAVVSGERTSLARTALPRAFRFSAWHHLAVEFRGATMRVEVTDARLGDPVAIQQLTLPASASVGAIGVVARGAVAGADNLGAARLYAPSEDFAPDPKVGMLDQRISDEFDDGRLDPAWSWIRSPDGEEVGGVYRWPTQDADLHLGGNNASVLLRDAPTGAYTVEAKLTIDLGIDTIRYGPQAGLVVYVDDDHYLRFTHTATGNTRWAEYGKEMPFSEGLATGTMVIGPPADTTWLRLAHRLDPVTDEHEFRAGVSLDGRTWSWGGVWTMPRSTRPQIGLISMSGSSATAEFDYVRFYVPQGTARIDTGVYSHQRAALSRPRQ
jgi:arabinan endo-1,5-alpha-L-arabinosidase